MRSTSSNEIKSLASLNHSLHTEMKIPAGIETEADLLVALLNGILLGIIYVN